jgi:hypothetical protein
MPELALAPGSAEAALTWRAYQESLRSAKLVETALPIDSESHDTTASGDDVDSGTIDSQSPTARINVPKRDGLAIFVASIYDKGSLVTLNKHSRIPPLDAPIDPRLFGQVTEIRSGGVTRKVNMRISAISEDTLKQIDACRKSIAGLLAKFSFALADGARLMPSAARPLFENELQRLDKRGRDLTSALLKGDPEQFVESNRDAIVKDLNGMHASLGLAGSVSPHVIERILGDLKRRWGKAVSGHSVPEISFTPISFRPDQREFSNSWGQAFSLLNEIAAFPREATTNPFFTVGFDTDFDDLWGAMNVAGDAFLDSRTRGKSRAKTDLELLARIKTADLDSRTKCELIHKIIRGDDADTVRKGLEEEEAAACQKEARQAADTTSQTEPASGHSS